METLRILFIGHKTEGDDFEAATGRETGWEVTKVDSDEAAIEQSCLSAFDVAVVGAGVGEEVVRKLRAVFSNLTSGTVLIKQNGGDTPDVDAVKAEVKRLTAQRRLERIGRIHVTDTLNVENQAGNIRLVP